MRPLGERFWKHVDKNGPVVKPELGPCRIWTAYTDGDGYGEIRVLGRNLRAHRVSWELNVGPIPSGQSPLHRCDNPTCIRPDHLFLGTHLENMSDRRNKRHYVLPSGEAHWNRKLSAEQVMEIRRLYIPREVSVRTLAARFNVSKTAIWHVLAGENWKCFGDNSGTEYTEMQQSSLSTN